MSFLLNIKQCVEVDKIAGDFAELGVWRGNTASILAYYARSSGRHCYLFDTFEGFSEKDTVATDQGSHKGDFGDTSLALVKEVMRTVPL